MSETLSADEARFLFVVNGVDADLAVLEFTVTERISHPFDVDLSLVSEDEVDFDAVIGKEALLTVRGEEQDRYFHGVVTLFRQTGRRGHRAFAVVAFSGVGLPHSAKQERRRG